MEKVVADGSAENVASSPDISDGNAPNGWVGWAWGKLGARGSLAGMPAEPALEGFGRTDSAAQAEQVVQAANDTYKAAQTLLLLTFGECEILLRRPDGQAPSVSASRTDRGLERRVGKEVVDSRYFARTRLLGGWLEYSAMVGEPFDIVITCSCLFMDSLAATHGEAGP